MDLKLRTQSTRAPRTSESSLLLPAKYRELRPGAVTHTDPKMKRKVIEKLALKLEPLV